jgi:hypothetical protein
MMFVTSGNSSTTSTNTPHSDISSPIHTKEPLLPKRQAVTSVIAAASATCPSDSNIFTAFITPTRSQMPAMIQNRPSPLPSSSPIRSSLSTNSMNIPINDKGSDRHFVNEGIY